MTVTFTSSTNSPVKVIAVDLVAAPAPKAPTAPKPGPKRVPKPPVPKRVVLPKEPTLPKPEPKPAPETAPPPEPAQPVEMAPPAGESGVSDLDARIRELEASIARDQQSLQAMIAEPAQGDGDSLAQSPELREIARRLPALQAELRRLRAERAAQQRP